MTSEIIENQTKHQVGDISEIKTETLQVNAPLTPGDLILKAIESKADILTLEKFMEMQERYEANIAHKSFTKAMAKFRGICPAIEKDSTVDYTFNNKRTNYNHASLGKTLEVIQPAMSECGLSHSWRTKTANDRVEITCIVTHFDGHSEQTSLPGPLDPSGGKNNIQSIGSTVEYLKRYTLFAILGLSAKEVDNDGVDGTNANPEQQKQPARKTKPSQKLIDRLMEILKSGDLFAFYQYLQKTTVDEQKTIFSNLLEPTKYKAIYREMETKAANLDKTYADLIEDCLVNNDTIGAQQYWNEIKNNQILTSKVYKLLSTTARSEFNSTIEV